MKACLRLQSAFALLSFLIAHAAWAELGITSFTRNGTLTWTNSVSDAIYRVESAASLAGPWSAVAGMESIRSSNLQVTVELGTPSPESMKLYRVIWTNAPPAQPIGTWMYYGFEGTSLVVTGLLSISATNPVVGDCQFGAVSNSNQTKHPVGSASFNGSMPTPNVVMIPDIALQNNGGPAIGYPSLRGQMALEEYCGTWWYNDFYIDTMGHTRIIVRSGKFSARREQ